MFDKWIVVALFAKGRLCRRNIIQKTGLVAVLLILMLLSAMVIGPGCQARSIQSPSPQTSQPAGEVLLNVGPTSKPPVIDGNLDDRCWQDATLASGFITTNGEWPAQQTTAYVTYDDSCLYIAFLCNEDAPEKLTANATGNDEDNIFSDDIVEFFLDTNHDQASYYHFALNPAGTRYEAYCDKSESRDIRRVDWNPDWEVKTAISTHNWWTAEIRIPFASLDTTSPEPNAVWGINLTRSLRGEAQDSEYSSWAAIERGFNQPEAFGELVFGAPADVSYSIISLGDPLTGSLLRIKLRNGKEAPLSVRTQWTVSPSWTGASSEVATTPLEPKAEREIGIPYAVPSRRLNDIPFGPLGVVEFALKVADAATGKICDLKEGSFVWEKGGIMDMSMDRYFYTPDVQQMQVLLTRETKEGASFEVEVKKQLSGKALATREIALTPGKDDYVASFDITDWDLGRHVVSAHLLADDGGRLYSIHRIFIKREIGPARTPSHTLDTRIRSDGIILRDGKPFCPFFSLGNRTSPLATDCFNVKFGKIALISNPLDRPKVGLPWVTVEKGEVFILLPEEEKMLRGIRGNVAPRKSDPSMFCWLIKYEARIPLYRGKDRVRLNNIEEFGKVERFVKSIDPNHLTSIHIEHPHGLPYKDLADIIEVAYKSSSYAKRLIPNLTRDLDEIRSVIGQGKPLIYWLGSSIPNPKYRTAEEIRCATYLTLMHGAAGIVFHMGHDGIDPSSTRHWSVYPGLALEVEELFSILTAPQQGLEPKITVSPGEIDYRVRRYNGRFYLIAVNTLNHLFNATVSIEDPSVILKRIRLPFENREIKPKESSFTDAFTAYEPHVYELAPVGLP